jgi:hypothetical protein
VVDRAVEIPRHGETTELPPDAIDQGPLEPRRGGAGKALGQMPGDQDQLVGVEGAVHQVVEPVQHLGAVRPVPPALRFAHARCLSPVADTGPVTG